MIRLLCLPVFAGSGGRVGTAGATPAPGSEGIVCDI